MGTTATFKFNDRGFGGTTEVQIHSDGYPAGAAVLLQGAVDRAKADRVAIDKAFEEQARESGALHDITNIGAEWLYTIDVHYRNWPNTDVVYATTEGLQLTVEQWDDAVQDYRVTYEGTLEKFLSTKEKVDAMSVHELCLEMIKYGTDEELGKLLEQLYSKAETEEEKELVHRLVFYARYQRDPKFRELLVEHVWNLLCEQEGIDPETGQPIETEAS